MYSGFFFIDSLVLVHLGTLRTYILPFSTSMGAKINLFFPPRRGEMKSHILSSWNWGFKKKYRHYDLHNEVTRVASVLDFIFQESLFCSLQYPVWFRWKGKRGRETKYEGSFPHHKHAIDMLLDRLFCW